MNTDQPPGNKTTCLDLNLLENVLEFPDKTIARCPACAAAGGDKKGNHLVIFHNGKYGCAANQGCAQHSREIFRLAGRRQNGPTSPGRIRYHRERVAGFQDLQRKQREFAKVSAAAFQRIITRYRWGMRQVLEDSPQPGYSLLASCGPRIFLPALFSPDDLLWTGHVKETGQQRHLKQWRSCNEWTSLPRDSRIGPFTTPALWKSGTFSRKADSVLSAPYTVLDFDELNGSKPSTPEEVAALVDASLAVIRWLREKQGWQLSAIVHTGNKSLHAWFRTPSPEAIESLKAISGPFGIDRQLIGKPIQPCRLPGHIHQKSGKLSRVLWLQKPTT